MLHRATGSVTCGASTRSLLKPLPARLLPLRSGVISSGERPGPLNPAIHEGASPSQRQHPGQRVAAKASASGASSVPDPQSNAPKRNNFIVPVVVTAIVLGAIYGLFTSPEFKMIKDFLMDGPLGRSGFLAAFSLIFLSEIGDKTFFIAAILAMRLGKWISYIGSVGALAIMTVISVAIGAVFSRVPAAIKSSAPIGEIAGILLLVFFGIKALRDGTKAEEDDGGDEELKDAESAIKEAETSGKVRKSSALWAALAEVGTLIFIAEWGDRSMLATIALGAAQNPFGVAVGAIAGHAIATGIAVVGGAIAAKHVSEKTINLASGVLFLVFAAATAYGMYTGVA